jgi:hypothetical protein
MLSVSQSTLQPRRLLSAIQRVTEIAVIGTLSETYRTCGRARCHCQSGGPKHRPHLQISYQGENGKTTGYYVPKVSEAATREGVAAWQQGAQFAASPRRRHSMKRCAMRFIAFVLAILLTICARPGRRTGVSLDPRIG